MQVLAKNALFAVLYRAAELIEGKKSVGASIRQATDELRKATETPGKKPVSTIDEIMKVMRD